MSDILNATVPGYPRLAKEMSNLPELMIFRKFSALNARNLLYMQNDLMRMESRLKQMEYYDSTKIEGDRDLHARDYRVLRNSALTGDGSQLNLVLEIRGKLKEYSMFGCPPHGPALTLQKTKL